jgi:hypothetical protein
LIGAVKVKDVMNGFFFDLLKSYSLLMAESPGFVPVAAT